MSSHDYRSFIKNTALRLVNGLFRDRRSDLTDARFLAAAQRMEEFAAARAMGSGPWVRDLKEIPRTEYALRRMAIREAAGRKI